MNGGITASLSSNKIGQQFSFDKKAGKWKGSGIWGTALDNGKVVNTPIIENLTITKRDSKTGEVLNGAKFNITLENVSSIMGYSSTGGSKIILRDVSAENYAEFVEGILKLERLVIKDQTNPITITIEESEAPLGYKKLDGKIVLTLQRVDENGNVEANKALRYLQLADVKIEGNISEEEFDVNQFDTLPKKLDDHAISLDIKNIPVMNIGGVVWEDKIGDGKEAEKNNKYDETVEEFEGIRVELWEGDSFKEFTTTDAAGKYLFKEVVKSDNYKVVFIYDGMTYETVKDSSDNHAEEVGRDSFNNKFKTINSETTVDEQKLWSADYYASYNDETVKTKLETLESTADNVKNPKTIFKMIAQVTVKEHLDDNGIDATNIKCGLTDRYFDLALGLDVSAATVEINGKSTTYTYEQILTANEIENAKENASEYLSMRLDKEGNLNKDASGNDVEYNLYLYESDYNYRIDDYKHGLPNSYKNSESDNTKISENAENYLPLEVYVTYKAIVYNQSSEKGYATKVINKYDPNIYTIVPNENIDPYSEAGKAIITLEKPEEGTRTQEIEITYKVNKDADGYLSLKDGDMANNKVEIYEYFSERGIVDYDSVPGNDREKEDDIDSALPLNVIVKDEEKRTITGIVFDDIDKDGNYKDNNLVNDVIVQLIELKEIDGIIYEYIWQETVSGRNTVKTTNRNGYPGNTYINTVAENGKYEFTGFIPGNYRVRFIYGDGTTYDLTQNVIDYNGQDYKSTYFKDETENYKKEWYNDTVYVGDTKAIDNEARRLETMAYSVNPDNLNKMEVLDEEITASTTEETKEKINDVLQNTWMCAETAKINVLVDTDDITSINSEQQNVTPKEEGLKIEEINLGLMKRIEAQISLEKHITALEVQIGEVTESKASIPDEHLEALMAGEIDSLTDHRLAGTVIIGSTIGLSMDSVANTQNRGNWSIQVPIDWELIVANTKFLVTYDYIVKNISNEQDYLSNKLMESYINDNLSIYISKLNGFANAMKFQRTMPEYQNSMSGMYLSNFYYTGQSGESKVTSRVEEIEEIVNPKIKYSAGDFIDKPHSEPYTIYNIDGNKEDCTNPTVKITTNTRTESLDIGEFDNFKATFLKDTLTAENNASYYSYIAQITKYSNATGRRLLNSAPGNLEYVHSDDSNIVIKDYNELDEFWGETVQITPKFGDDKQTPMQIAIIIISAVAMVGVGIILIKKFVLKK